MSEVVRRLCVVGMMVLLLLIVRRMVGLRLEFRDRHAKPLVGLTAIHHDMLALVCLTIHIVKRCDRSSLVEGRGSGGGGGVGVEFQSTRRGIGPVSNDVSLMRILLCLSLEVELPGPRLLEPVGTICHLMWQTRPCVVSLMENLLVGRCQVELSRGGERSRGSEAVSSLLPHRDLTRSLIKPRLKVCSAKGIRLKRYLRAEIGRKC